MEKFPAPVWENFGQSVPAPPQWQGGLPKDAPWKAAAASLPLILYFFGKARQIFDWKNCTVI